MSSRRLTDTKTIFTQGVEIKDKVNFGIVTPRTSSIVLLTVLNQLDRELEDTEWILARLKADTGPSASGE